MQAQDDNPTSTLPSREEFLARVESLTAAGNKAALVPWLDLGRSWFPDDPDVLFLIAQLLRERARLDEAIAILEPLSKHADHFVHLRGLVDLGEAYRLKGELDAAETSYRAASLLEPLNPWPVRGLIEIAAQRGDARGVDALVYAYCTMDPPEGKQEVIFAGLGAKISRLTEAQRRAPGWAPLPPRRIQALERAGFVMMVKNEADIVARNLEHHYALGFRVFCILDNRSTDTTGALIAAFRNDHPDCLVVSVFDPVVGYYQADKMRIFANTLVEMAKLQDCTLDWIFYVDADEFIAPADIGDPYAAFEAALVNPANRALVFYWLHGLSHEVLDALPADADPFEVFNRWQTRFVYPAMKVALRPGLYPRQGNHTIAGAPPPYGTFAPMANLGWHYFHFPMRSIAQLKQKVINGATANIGFKGLENHAEHWKAYYHEYQKSGEGIWRALIVDFAKQMLDEPQMAPPQPGAGRNFSRFVSIGPDGRAAAILEAAGLHREPYPFDAIFSCPDIIAECLEDDFAKFLDPNEFTPTHEGRSARHEYYQNRYSIGDISMFQNHNPTLATDRAYYEHCVAHLREALRDPSDTMLFMLFDEYVLEHDIPGILPRIQKAAGGAPILVLAIRQSETEPRGKTDIVWREGSLIIARIVTRSGCFKGPTFDDPRDTENVATLLKNIRRS